MLAAAQRTLHTSSYTASWPARCAAVFPFWGTQWAPAQPREAERLALDERIEKGHHHPSLLDRPWRLELFHRKRASGRKYTATKRAPAWFYLPGSTSVASPCVPSSWAWFLRSRRKNRERKNEVRHHKEDLSTTYSLLHLRRARGIARATCWSRSRDATFCGRCTHTPPSPPRNARPSISRVADLAPLAG